MTFFLYLILSVLISLISLFIYSWVPYYLRKLEEDFISEFLDYKKNDSEIIKKNNVYTYWNGLDSSLLLIFSLTACLLVLNFYGFTIKGCLIVAFVSSLIVLAAIDFKTKYLPDVITFPLMWLGILVQFHSMTETVNLGYSVMGCVFGYLPLWLLAKLYSLVRKRNGLGHGDLKLLAMIGAWMGPLPLPKIIFLASLFAIIYKLLVNRIKMEDKSIEFAFGPWIVLATILIFLTKPI